MRGWELASPESSAVMAWVPAERVALEQVAAALASGTAVQSAVPPSRKVTVPVGVPEDPETLAVNVTWLPAVLGLLEEASECSRRCRRRIDGEIMARLDLGALDGRLGLREQ